MKTGRRSATWLAGWGLVAAVAVVAVVRLVQAGAGSIPAARAAGEVVLLLSLTAMALIARQLVQGGSTATWALAGLGLVVWSAGVALPLWRFAHPAPPLFDGTLGGAVREVQSTPPPADGRYLVHAKMEELERGTPPPDRLFTLNVTGRSRDVVQGVAAGTPVVAEVALERGKPAVIFLEWSVAPVHVRLLPVTLPRGFILGGAGLALLLALFADLAGFRAWPRGRGLLVAIVATSGLFLALADPDGALTGRALLGSGGLAIVGGGLAGGVFSYLGGVLARVALRRRAD